MPATLIDDIKKTTFNVKSPERDCWIDRQGNIIPNETHHHVEKALELIASFDEINRATGRPPLHLEQFKAANRNKGYDAGEWLVTMYGYIAIEGYKAIYSAKKKPTQKQQKAIDCILYEDTLIDCSSEIALKIKNENLIEKKREEEKAARERKWCINKREYYSKWQNQFHSPSGFPRQDYLRWQRLCNKHGVSTQTRRTYFTSSY